MILRAKICVAHKHQGLTCTDCDNKIETGERYILFEELGPGWGNPAEICLICAANSKNEIWVTAESKEQTNDNTSTD